MKSMLSVLTVFCLLTLEGYAGDYSVSLSEMGLEFVKLNSSNRVILLNRTDVVIKGNVTQINAGGNQVYGRREDGVFAEDFILKIDLVSAVFFPSQEAMNKELKLRGVEDIQLFEPGDFKKKRDSM